MKHVHDSEGTGEDPTPTEPERPPTRAERIEQLLLIGGFDAPTIRAKLIEEGIATRVSLATVEKEIETIYSRWQATAVTSVTDATLRHLARYRDLYARTLALAASAEASSPKVALAALVQAAKLNEAEARLLGASDRHLNRGWLERVYWEREQQERARERAEEERAAAEARAERERERVAHNERWELWEEQVDDELLERAKEALAAAGEEVALKLLTKAGQLYLRGEYAETVAVPDDDPWESEWQGEEGIYLEDIEDPRTCWSALARVELADHPQALELVLEAIASYEPPEHPGPYWPREEEEVSPTTDLESSDLELLELLRDRSGLN